MRAGSRRVGGRGACMFRNSRRFCLSPARKAGAIPAGRQARCMGSLRGDGRPIQGTQRPWHKHAEASSAPQHFTDALG
jgi:hypothetical protein